MKKVVIIGGGFSYAKMYEQAGFEVVKTLEEADLVQFTGGSDVSPEMYGEREHPTTFANPQRDAEEKWIFERCIELKKPMVGICRGSQFLNVMNGGKLYQDVNNHAIAGTHEMTCVYTGDILQVSSTHHQMMRPAASGKLLGFAKRATRKEFYPKDSDLPTVVEDPQLAGEKDTEVVYYADTRCLCYQPHPEIMGKDSDCRKHFIRLVNEVLL